MRIVWTGKASADLVRLHDFLANRDARVAARLVQALVSAPLQLLTFPRLGSPLEEFRPRDVRRLFVGRYELRYELRNSEIVVLRVWHAREER